MKKRKMMIPAALLLTSIATMEASHLTLWVPSISEKTDSVTMDSIRSMKNISLGGASVRAHRKRNTETAVVADQRKSLVVQNAVSAQQIAKTQDKDASEVLRRVPGVSLIDEKFVMVRGLSQRYNNVWLNGGAVPSSEADARAFSFDIIPSSQIDNLTIVKSPAPEYPADFTGGFILINTKEMPQDGGLELSVGTSVNDRTHFRSFLEQKGTHTPFSNLNKLKTFAGSNNFDLLHSGLNHDWGVKSIHPFPDLKGGGSYSKRWQLNPGQMGLLAALNFSNTHKSYTNMENSLYGAYDETNQKPVYLRQSTDDQYTADTRIGGMLNLTFRPANGTGTYEWKNLFNTISRNRYTERIGINAQNDKQHNTEYYNSARTTFNTQFTGKHSFGNQKIDWNAGYAYANRNLPDRRVVELNDRTENRMGLYSVGREWTQLDEHIFSLSASYQRKFTMGNLEPTLKAGAYGEYRTRKYDTRSFNYSWNPTLTTLPPNFQFSEDVEALLATSHYGADKLYMKEEVNFTNNYEGRNTQGAGYAGINVPLTRFNVYAGVRYEYSRTELITNTRQTEKSPISTFYNYSDLFPSLNAGYKLTQNQQLRFAYGRSINRPEFRELSPVVYYDFDLASNVQGNSNLKAALIDNLDLRYELYPSAGEMFSVALFYKHFKNPIEWTYTVNGGTDLTYSNKNAETATSYGIEVDLRKTLDFIGLRNLSLSLNGSWIKSDVSFASGSREQGRPMQGQSPYLINAGLFYQNKKHELSAALLYNCIGKRLVGVGRSLGTSGSEDTKDIPSSYEMPRNTIDLSVSKKLGKWELKASVRDLLAEVVKFQQLETVNTHNGTKEIEEVTKKYKPGRNIGLSASYSF
ncbi:MAG: TonB-dependent receptor [Bacteroidaceae bacterium]